MSHHLKSEICFIHIRPRSGHYSSIFLNWTDSRLLQDWATSFPFIEPESNHCLPLPQTFVDLNYLTWIEVTNSRSKGNLFQRLQVHWKSFPLPFNFMSVLLKLPFFIFLAGPFLISMTALFLSFIFWEVLLFFLYFWKAYPFSDYFGRPCHFWYFGGRHHPFLIFSGRHCLFLIFFGGPALFWQLLTGLALSWYFLAWLVLFRYIFSRFCPVLINLADLFWYVLVVLNPSDIFWQALSISDIFWEARLFSDIFWWSCPFPISFLGQVLPFLNFFGRLCHFWYFFGTF